MHAYKLTTAAVFGFAATVRFVSAAARTATDWPQTMTCYMYVCMYVYINEYIQTSRLYCIHTLTTAAVFAFAARIRVSSGPNRHRYSYSMTCYYMYVYLKTINRSSSTLYYTYTLTTAAVFSFAARIRVSSGSQGHRFAIINNVLYVCIYTYIHK